jgi:excisionase family DNA binding protein
VSAHDERLVTVQDVARRFNVPVSWVYAKAEANELPHVKLGRYVPFRPAEIEAYLSAQRRGGDAKSPRSRRP